MTAAITITGHPDCGGATVTVLRLHRCQGCGHRVTVNGVAPVETRRQPWRAPAELLGRHLARKAA